MAPIEDLKTTAADEPKPEPQPKTSPKVKDNADANVKAKASVDASGSKNHLWFVVAPLVVALLGGAWTRMATPHSAVPFDHRKVSELPPGANATRPLANVIEPDVFKPKYQSELVHINTQRLLVQSSGCRAFDVVGDLTHVEEAMNAGADKLRADGQVFLMLNGQNDGLYFSWSLDDGCLFELATKAALALGADVDLLPNGVRLMTQDGRPITTAKQLDDQAGRIAHVLLDGQIWVWPGIKLGHVFEIEGYTVKTHSMRPKVFTVEAFLSQEEANTIMEQGLEHLSRSPVDSPDAVDGYHADRTSDTAFLNDNAFTREFRQRVARLTRLPSPSFVERLQLVRYKTGQFFRKHEDYFNSKQFLPRQEIGLQDYEEWTKWAAKQLTRVLEEDATRVPEAFRPGGAMFPSFDDKMAFQHALLQAFLDDADAVDFFFQHADVDWGTWIRDNVRNKASDVMSPLMADRSYMLRHIIDSWEKRVGLPELKYHIPKREVSGVTHYFRWIRWAKERVQDVMDKNINLVPAAMRPDGDDYPTYHIRFQNRLLSYVLEDNTAESLAAVYGQDWTDWLLENKDSEDVLLQAFRTTQTFFDKVVESWTKRAGDRFTYKKPAQLRHFEPNRYVTVFMYLNDCPEGGETVFPYSRQRLVTDITREGMAECSEGLAVPPTKLTAAMFYSQTPENEMDPSSLHGGCPPAQGVKFGSNAFAWNADADEGANAWNLGADLKLEPET
ncbi:TPA: hypothetical protein N0F65_002033 [Lagenidium giganteum]|uniref:Prolyl 4-hydroxylase alpha subunit domain-containing protein n=1 Tax=Lagenidium giganteum TaxID=4803 RepID=A0AAV2Z2Q9_9STRA|nr:TPA: hypothetical protein N0F65_002033 [Lagenidium giganteum]